tara:strand:+ start:350 stop:550 length:201 start_codon:yes stop_codon:yes gene_type:complete
MGNNIKIILIIILGALALIIFGIKSDYNLKKTISACMVAQKQTSKNYDKEKAKKYCTDQIKKSISK